jgi:AraC-like DNA-binding protein
MDGIEGGVLSGIPASALTLTLTRSAIRMHHTPSWAIDKTNTVHDLLICLEGAGRYRIDGEELRLAPGEGLFIPKDMRFVGWSDTSGTFTGVAQHFTLELFASQDLMARLRLRRKVRFTRWEMVEPLARHYRAIAPASSTTMLMHHLFMVLLNEYIEDAFEGWAIVTETPADAAEGLPTAVMLAATQIASDPLTDQLADRVVAAAPYNPDYFTREFRARIGCTPRKFQEFKRMERAMHLLEGGKRVSETAEAVGYGDVYYFSRMFRRYIGISPRGYQRSVQQDRDGRFPRGEEDGQIRYPLHEAARPAQN